MIYTGLLLLFASLTWAIPLKCKFIACVCPKERYVFVHIFIIIVI